jgi:hypothetical protein
LSPRLAVAVAAIIIFAAAIAAAEVIHAGHDEAPEKHRGTASPEIVTATDALPGHGHPSRSMPPATAGLQPSDRSAELLGPGAAASWARLSASIPAQIGLAVVPLGTHGDPQILGSLQLGHAWSSIKVPIVVTLMRDGGGEGLDAEEQTWARAALTASDNEAAASLFGRLEAIHGGLSEASLAIQGLLGEADGGSTYINTEPPPPGAVSTYGQTEWSLTAAAQFYAALGGGCLLDPSGTDYVLGLMEEVISEQSWGLGQAGFPPEWQVGYKAGWGPEGGASGSYLVRQSGVVRDGGGGVAVAMIALDESGSFEAGAADLTRIATWLRENLHTPLPVGSGC